MDARDSADLNMGSTSSFSRLLLTAVFIVAGMLSAPGSATTPDVDIRKNVEARRIDWETLLPSSERENYKPDPPPAVHDYLGEGSLPALQTGSFAVNKEVDGLRIRLPGFVIPLERSADGLISEFYLVPYFGACIHVPPPPPNQMVYVRMRAGAGLRSVENAMRVTGTLHTSSRSSPLGAAAYTLDGEKLEPYE